MGSWSVSCEVSKIAITSGHDAVIIPLKKVESGGGYGYWNWQIATLPIFGKYNDYGGMEDIVEDDNTKIIEEHFGVSIDDFITFLVDGKHYYGRDEAEEAESEMKNLEECADWKFCWLDRKVYDVLIKNNDTWNRGQLDFGTPKILEMFGFTQVENPSEVKNYDPKRFKYVWQKDGVTMYSDGKSLLAESGQYVWHYGHGSANSIEHYVSVPEGLEHLKNLNKAEAWRFMDPKKFKTDFAGIMSNRYEYEYGGLEELMEVIVAKLHANGEEVPEKYKPKPSKIHRKYFDNLEAFGDRIAHLYNLMHNMHSMSSELLPHVLYLTPQCGEFDKHQLLLEEFVKINKGYCREHDDEQE